MVITTADFAKEPNKRYDEVQPTVVEPENDEQVQPVEVTPGDLADDGE